MHVYFPELRIDLRGVHVTKTNDYWRFEIPMRTGIDEETGESRKYPVFTFDTEETHKELIKTIIEEGKKYIIEKVLSVPMDSKKSYVPRPMNKDARDSKKKFAPKFQSKERKFLPKNKPWSTMKPRTSSGMQMKPHSSVRTPMRPKVS